METAPPESTHLFFKHLRRADWRARHRYNPTDRPEQALFDFIIQNELPIYLGLLTPEHSSMQIGLFPHLSPMNATVFPENEQRMADFFAEGEFELVPSHVLGAIINSRGRECPGNQRMYAQLGTVLVRPHSLTKWSRTDFVFAAEIDEHGKAALLWMLEKSHVPYSDPHNVKLQPYLPIELRTIANIPTDRRHPQVLLELHCGQAGWRERSKAKDYVGVGLTDLIYYASPERVHFVRVAQTSTGSLRHATLTHSNLTETAGPSSAPIWVCAWCSPPHTASCPHLNGEIV